jgi:glycosyltransferase involved in cell wall biosynthesis
LHGGIRSAPASLNFNNRISQWSANHADMVVANSKAGLSAFGQESNLKARVIYNGLDLARFKGIETQQIQHDLCMVANFSSHKDHPTLVNAMALIVKVYPGAKLLLVGHDAGTLSSTRELVNKLDLTESVVFVTDSVKPYQLIANSSICILSTYSEGISNAILEYFAFSKPVIASDVVGNTEIIVPDKNGYLVEAGSAEALADKVIMLLSNPELGRKLGEYGKEMVIEKFSVESMISSYETTFLDLLERSGGS